ncbi:MAG: CHAT domain-containing protein [Alphaproteobacteria bacterium]
MKRVVVAIFGLLAMGGCQDERPAMSLDEARRVQAGFQGQAAFVPPPRTISDITALLAQASPDPARVAALSAASGAEPPASASPAALYGFLVRRAQARGELGLVDGQVRDLREAARIGEANRLDTSRAYQELMAAESFVGNARNAHDAAIKRLQAARASGRMGNISAGEAGLANRNAQAGDLAAAERGLAAARRALADPGYQRSSGYQASRRMQEALILRAEAEVRMAEGRYAEAERSSRAALENEQWNLANKQAIKAVVPDVSDDLQDSQLLVSLAQLGNVLRMQGRLVEAEVEFRRALVHALRVFGRDSLRVAALSLNLSRNMLEQRRFAESRQLAEVALATYDRYGVFKGSRFVALGNLLYASAAREEGDIAASDAAIDRALAVFADDPDERFRRVESQPGFLVSRIESGRATAIMASAERLASERARNFGERHYETAQSRGILAAAQAATGKREEALAGFRASVPVLLQVSRQSEDEEGGAQRERVRRFVLESYVDLLSSLPASAGGGLDPAAEAFRVADAARAQGVQRALAESAARSGIRDPGLAALVRQEQDARKQIAAQFGLLSNILSSPASQQDAAATASLRTSIDTLRRARASLREEIERRFPDYASLIDPRPATVEDVQSQLRAGEALVSVYVGQARSFVWAVPKSGPAAFAAVAAGEKDIAQSVARLRRALDPNAATLGDIPAFDVALAHRLHEQFLAPVRAGLAGAESLLVVPDKALGQIPFSLLVTRAVPAPADTQGRALFSGYAQVPFLAREKAVTQLPSVASLGALRRLAPGEASRKPFIGFGDPYFSTEQAAAGSTQVAQLTTRGLQTRGLPLVRRNAPQTQSAASAELASLPRLPDTADEVRSIAVALKADPSADVFLGLQASEARVKGASLSDRKVVMFATHGLVPGDLNGLTQPALALTAPAVAGSDGDGLLTMDEVLGLRLNADWVVLSACNTATGDGAGAEAVSGLGRAFFYAGTRALLVTNWPVETTSARALTTDLFARQAADPGLARAKAAQQAMLALIDGPGFVEGGRTVFSYAHPIFWAPFSVVGDGG